MGHLGPSFAARTLHRNAVHSFDKKETLWGGAPSATEIALGPQKLSRNRLLARIKVRTTQFKEGFFSRDGMQTARSQ